MPLASIAVAAGEFEGAEEFDRDSELSIQRLPLSFPTWGLLGHGGWRQYWRSYRRLLGLIKRTGARAIHCGKCLPEGLLARMLSLRLGIPYIVFVHGEEMRVAGGSRELTWLTRRVLAGAQSLIANSHNTAELLQREWQVARGRIQVLHPGVDTERFKPAAPNPELRCRLGWGQRPVVLTVGRLQTRKGQDMLIRALPAIREHSPDVLYSIIGDGAERSTLERLTDELGVRGHVQFRGAPADEELVSCYQQCDLFALPNREINGDFEGFGMVLVEAQACGKPVLAGASGGTAETMNLNETGVIVQCDEPKELAQRIAALLSDRVRLAQIGTAARHWAVEQFDWSSLCRRAEAMLLPGCKIETYATSEVNATAP
jgi:phosphatidylinositol alpha-1,6-mannosyltransferase